MKNYETRPAGSHRTEPEILIQSTTLPAHQQKLGIALAGLGKYSTGYLGPALLNTNFCYLSAVISGTPAKFPQWKAAYSLPDNSFHSYSDFNSIRDNENIDIVYIALPDFLHKQFALKVAEAGKHAVCEIPMALTEKDCDQMIDAFAKAGKKLGVAYRPHYDPLFHEMIKASRNEIFGKVKNVHAGYGFETVAEWPENKDMPGNAPLLHMAIYCNRAVLAIMDAEPSIVRRPAATEHRTPLSEEIMPPVISWEMEFPNRAVATCEVTEKKSMSLLHADAEHGWFELSPAFSINGNKAKTATGFIRADPVNQLTLLFDDYARAIINGESFPFPGESGRKDIQLMHRVFKIIGAGAGIPG